jgi:hypothetical protein
MNETAVLVTLFSLFASGTPVQDKPPSATVRLSERSVAAGIGYSWGAGTLTYLGKRYVLKIHGLSIGRVGVSQVEASGNVFNLAKVEDVSGHYTAAGVEGTLGEGVGATALRNQNGVVINLTSSTRGVSFKVAPEGMRITRAQ